MEYPNNVEELKSRAELGDTHATYDLGKCYQEWNRIEPNIELAIFWHEKARSLGLEAMILMAKKIVFFMVS